MLNLKAKNGASFMIGGSYATVTAGPSKWDLSVALFSAGERVDRTVDLTITALDLTTYNAGGIFQSQRTNQPVKIGFAISSVEREDGSGESWNISGYITSINDTPVEYVTVPQLYFQTRTRQGTLSFPK